MFTLTWGDLWRGIVMAVLGPVMVAALASLSAVIQEPGFNIFAVDWVMTFKNVANVAVVAAYISGSSYLLKNFLTDQNKNFLSIPTKS